MDIPDDPPNDDRVPHRHGHGRGSDKHVMRQANDLMGYDVVETKLIEADTEFHARILERLANPDRMIPAEQVFGPLDDH